MSYQTPDQIYKNLFQALHLSGIWSDGKAIADAIALFPPEEIVADYEKQKDLPHFDLQRFFELHFKLQSTSQSGFRTDKNKSEEEHIRSLWDVLCRPADTPQEGSSLIPLPYPYLVPGGRFNEIYYWDSYFTMLGLRLHQRWDIIEGMINNFAWMIDQIGFIPNGNRTYFLGRSQPPFFSSMVELLAKEKGETIFVQYLPALLKEYAFWMSGTEKLSPSNPAAEHVVQVEGGVLNRYYDHFYDPRQEMYLADIEIQEASGRESQKLFLDIRAACESGWDFSSRWFDDQQSLNTINTSEIIPVDLNCLLFHLETTISKASALAGAPEQSAAFQENAESRKTLIQNYCWNEQEGYFYDWQFARSEQTPVLSLAGVFPLFFGLATPEQALRVKQKIEQHLLAQGGALSTNNTTGQQWDAPNGWAPLQWMTVAGLDRYGRKKLASEIAERWTELNEKVYRSTGKFLEKYNVQDLSLEAGGGEYPVQDGFGWSNGVYLALKNYLKR